MLEGLIVFLAIWLAWNIYAPYSVLKNANFLDERRIPAGLRDIAKNMKAPIYIAVLKQPGGYSVWLPGRGDVIVLVALTTSHSTPDGISYLIAHELGHVSLRHTRIRWFASLFLFGLLCRWQRQEEAADKYAEKMTGFRRVL